VQRILGYGKENTKFICEGSDVLADDNGGTLTKYLNGPGIDNKLRQTTGLSVSYFLSDHLGSTNGLTDATGALTASNSYDSFGNATNASFPTRYQFTGRELDSFTGLQYNRARSYDPNLGRFISEDPIGFGGGDINFFGYVWNNPYNYYDPLGLDGWGNDFADWGDGNIGYARRWWKSDPQNWGWNGGVDTVADLASGFSDMFRVGSGLGKAIYCEDLPDYRRFELIATDVVRGGGLFLTMAGPFAGRVGSSEPVRSPGGPKPSPKFQTPTNPPQFPPTDIPEGWRVRTGAPTEQYPNGYWRLEKPMNNGGWQGMDPSTMKPGTHPETHIPLPPR
jgi:RHS repeat-associated protein